MATTATLSGDDPPAAGGDPARILPLPIELPYFPGYDMDAKYGTARIGGDFFDVAANQGSLVVLLTDIAGERHDTVDLAVQVQEAFRYSAAAVLAASSDAGIAGAIVFALRSINLALMSAAQGVRCAPTFLARVDIASGRMAYVNAGAAPALLGTKLSQRQLESHGLPLGLFNELAHETQWAELQTGAWLVLVSKGVVEARGRSDEFGVTGVQEVVGRQNGSARETNRRILRSAIEFAHGAGSGGFFGPALNFAGFRRPELEQDMTAFTMVRTK